MGVTSELSKTRTASIQYTEAAGGSDALDGTSPETAWRTLPQASKTVYSAGDRFYGKRITCFIQKLFVPRRSKNGYSYASAEEADLSAAIGEILDRLPA